MMRGGGAGGADAEIDVMPEHGEEVTMEVLKRLRDEWVEKTNVKIKWMDAKHKIKLQGLDGKLEQHLAVEKAASEAKLAALREQNAALRRELTGVQAKANAKVAELEEKSALLHAFDRETAALDVAAAAAAQTAEEAEEVRAAQTREQDAMRRELEESMQKLVREQKKSMASLRADHDKLCEVCDRALRLCEVQSGS